MGAVAGGLLMVGLLALLAGGGSRSRTGGRVSAQTRGRVRDTLGTPDSRARSIPVETAPAPVEPDMTFRPDAAGRYPGEPGYVDPDARPPTRRGATSTSTSTSGRGQSAWAASRSGGSSTTTTTGTASREAESMTTTPPDDGPHGTVTFPTADDVTREAEPAEDSGDAEPASEANPTEARSLAASTARAIHDRSTGWRNRLRAFQRAAGLPVDGRYGGRTYNALRHFGIRNPPAALSAPRPSSAAARYP